MESLDQAEASIRQSERDTNLASLLFIARELGKLEGITESLGVVDPRITSTQDDLHDVYNRLVMKVGLSNYMKQQELDLVTSEYGNDY